MDHPLLKRRKDISFLSYPELDELPCLRHAYSTRMNPGTSPGDESGGIHGDRSRFLEALGLEQLPLVRLQQQHSDIVIPIDGGSQPPISGDALVTQRPACVLAVEVADCLAVLLLDAAQRVVAAIHAGWRGTLKEISKKTVLRMRQIYGSRPEDCYAAFGPAIDVCCYEVGDDVAERFFAKITYADQLFRSRGDERMFLNLREANRIQLTQVGIPEERILDRAGCTLCLNDIFFSYRKEGFAAGRMMGVIALTPTEGAKI